MSGDVRNDIYITVEQGSFEKGTKRSERNVEVAIEVFDGANKLIPVSAHHGMWEGHCVGVVSPTGS